MKGPVGYAKRPVRYVKRPVRYVKSLCLSCKPTSQGACGRSHFLPVLPSAGLKKAQACSPGPLPDSCAGLIISYSGRVCQLFFRDFGAQRKPPYRIHAAAADFTLLSDHPPVVSRRRRGFIFVAERVQNEGGLLISASRPRGLKDTHEWTRTITELPTRT